MVLLVVEELLKSILVSCPYHLIVSSLSSICIRLTFDFGLLRKAQLVSIHEPNAKYSNNLLHVQYTTLEQPLLLKLILPLIIMNLQLNNNLNEQAQLGDRRKLGRPAVFTRAAFTRSYGAARARLIFLGELMLLMKWNKASRQNLKYPKER